MARWRGPGVPPRFPTVPAGESNKHNLPRREVILPATALQADAQDAALGFERVAPPARAALAWRALLGRWPEKLLAGIGLANTVLWAGNAAGARATQVLIDTPRQAPARLQSRA